MRSANRRTIVLLVVLGLCGAAWAAASLSQRDRPSVRALDMADLAAVPQVVGVRARPPSLFVELDAASWSTLASPQRLAALDELGKVAAAAGYSGLHARTSDGTSAGQWLLRGGASLAAPPRGDT